MTPELLLIISGATLGVVEVIKKLILPKDENSQAHANRMRFVPLIGLLIGVGMTLLISDVINRAVILQGIIIGLTAMGLYSGPKATAGK